MHDVMLNCLKQRRKPPAWLWIGRNLFKVCSDIPRRVQTLLGELLTVRQYEREKQNMASAEKMTR